MTTANLGSARIVASIWRDTVRQRDERIAELEVSLRRAIALIDKLHPWVMWDGVEYEEDEQHADTTLGLLRQTLEK